MANWSDRPNPSSNLPKWQTLLRETRNDSCGLGKARKAGKDCASSLSCRNARSVAERRGRAGGKEEIQSVRVERYRSSSFTLRVELSSRLIENEREIYKRTQNRGRATSISFPRATMMIIEVLEQGYAYRQERTSRPRG